MLLYKVLCLQFIFIKDIINIYYNNYSYNCNIYFNFIIFSRCLSTWYLLLQLHCAVKSYFMCLYVADNWWNIKGGVLT